MPIIKIGTLNVKNSDVNRGGGIRIDKIDNSFIIGSVVVRKRFDIFGLQEITPEFSRHLSYHIRDFKIYGDYRYGNNCNVPFLKWHNESNPIITREKINETVTYKLPYAPKNGRDLFKGIFPSISIMPRIATVTLIKNSKYNNICAINTHLDYRLPNLQKEQLEKLKQIINFYQNDYEIILTGDFNMDISNPNFKSFKESLEKIDLKRVEVNDSTHPISTYAIDHIFVPNSFEIEKAGVFTSDELNDVTDHKGVYVKIKK